MPRDGDEEGHLGAAELFAQLYREGRWVEAARDALAGRLGEYPPLWPAMLGLGWWALGGAPEDLPLRAVPLISMGITAAALSSFTRSLLDPEGVDGPGGPAARAGRLAAALCLLLPLPVGLARHYMPEAPLMAAVAAAIALGERAAQRPSPGRLVAYGLTLGAALLIKQTAALTLWLPALALALRQGPRGVFPLLVAGLCFAPWLLRNLEDQLQYAQNSADAQPAPLWAHALGVPAQWLWSGLGPPLGLLTLGALAAAAGRRRLSAWSPALLWLIGGLLGLWLIPKKYPRLVLPTAPAALPLLAAALAGGPRWAAPLALSGGAGWLLVASLHRLPEPPLSDVLDPRCPQTWLGPSDPDDLGLGATVAALARLPPGPVAVIAPPAIPCAVQTTHDWVEHLGPRLRRAGQERELHVNPAPADAAAAVFILRFGPDGRPLLPQPAP
ncbi:MAG: hypothetical protein RL071_3416 [Pseudomonadota bacterium]